MVKVDIFRNSKNGYDIVVLDFEQYLGTTLFEYASAYLYTRLSSYLSRLLGPNDEKDQLIPTEDDICPCMEYRGIAIKLTGFLDDIPKRKEEFSVAAQDILEYLDN